MGPIITGRVSGPVLWLEWDRAELRPVGPAEAFCETKAHTEPLLSIMVLYGV